MLLCLDAGAALSRLRRRKCGVVVSAVGLLSVWWRQGGVLGGGRFWAGRGRGSEGEGGEGCADVGAFFVWEVELLLGPRRVLVLCLGLCGVASMMPLGVRMWRIGC